MKFVKYGSITNSYRQEFIDKILFEEKDRGDWIVTEKIHGANFSLWVDKDTIRMAKRSAFIPDDSEFYGAQDIKEDLFKKARILFDWIATKSEIEYMAIFGELFGGSYPHKDVPVNPKARKVQKGVWYSPNNEFIVYDIKVDGVLQSFRQMEKHCVFANLDSVTPLFVGSFKDCLTGNNEFPSAIYKRYNLPEIEDNVCEGIVIRPDDARFIFDHSRVMLKSKNARFTEKESEKKTKIKVELSGELKSVLEELETMATGNRYDSVVSKIGEVTPKDFGMILGLMVKDILEEMEGDTALRSAYNKLEKVERKTVNKMLGHSVSRVVKKRLIWGE